ncbi:amidohydrolase [Paenarthrobacter aurescens]|uniref:Amidohydrolase n=1 Tax=Paenarthrobacter aurescens TaxID=43663 RepID=A0A4Y3NDG2_PAEAU|nr:amidohydrolase family protein [Paenarthrobacter aurescens]MDO6143633.1 amidohydrolase family protein [Paenarthrobacter aurescens]MDO6147481.1 amidohydrolase family protein [Paenarthrobacter aurescens]MDO6158724.1 amidohydrolase family protein [Paenarthrobacter aurescens]MDO6162708.1 amidohydrolase family protein [Paenarthrobacter aurescens]GEB19283.1 amidohydrolase [Paenarthrobacter aurescens]
MNQPGVSAGPDRNAKDRKVTMYRNGSIYTAADPFATAMVVDGDTVAWVGSEQAATSIADSSMEIIDLKGALLAPGFVDSHAHLTETGIALSGLQLSGVRSATQLLDAVASAGGTGTVLGHGWDETTWTDPTIPTLEEIQRAAPGRHVYLSRIDVHSALVSPSLVAAAGLQGLDGFSGEPRVVRAAHTAARLAARNFTESERRGYQEAALQEAASNGYVALAEMSAPHICGSADLRMAASWNDHGNTPEVLPYWGELATSQEHAQAILDGLGTTVLGLAGDLNMDGSIGSRTAALVEDYSDADGQRGSLYLSVDDAAKHLVATSLLGIQAGFHVIGDAGLGAVLDAFDAAAAEVGEQRLRAAGHRLEHVEMADQSAIERLARFSVSVSVQPAFDAAWGAPGGLYEHRLGERSQRMNPFASFYASGVPIAFGSDSPVTPLRPWSSVRACLEHSNPEQRISARAAFLGHTRAGWRATKHRNPLMGQLVPGAPASFAVWEVEELMVQVADSRVQSWSTDPRARTPLLPALDTGSDPRCLQTVREGHELFAHESLRV